MDVIRDLEALLGPENVSDDELVIKLYSKDAWKFEGSALVVVFPRSTEDVSKIVRYAYKNNLKVYPQGSASELVGSSTPSKDGIILSFERMKRIKEVDVVSSYITVEPGITIWEMNLFLAKYGYMFPVDPASVKAATVGGALSTGAGGLMGAKYGTMKDWVLGMTVVLPDENGTVLHIGGKTTKDRTGYDLVRLIVGSEGTLAIITEATLKIVPIPEALVTVVAFFASLEDLMNAVIEIKKNRISPFMMELIDSATVRMILENIGSRIRGEGHYLMVSVDTTSESIERILNTLEGILRKNNASQIFKARSQAEAEEMGLLDIRRNLYPGMVLYATSKLKDPTSSFYLYGEDISVPPSKLVEAVKRFRELEAKYGIPITLGGHVGDGNLHPAAIVYEEEKKEIGERISAEIMDIAISLGGTISSEHGIGTLKKEKLKHYFEERESEKALEIMRAIKKVFDPKGILNPGKVI
ncbi:MAG: glycolate oxidase subunit GlcD [Thermoproteota archaeon]|jgi:glycolate oxidase|uniref:FAD-binding protein n=1 Tax=Candidatus Methanodesulfokora washburnensis TaxID=2478471 RepID=A0A429GEK9_9CREN|nr:FAD-linked oxidase C-terminal domain-containing protein [Candidatus Methanodesulfokores washburnensis]RSN72211.1 FAD-binding protein [Candidatus Methanodesulfokores washburnensis]RZN63580.1 MAG: FAD-binding protein [Candidatus Methanodesulfokores washburnensis]TDA41207.1 MAG: glycolate oxidase subunit GlcD [Candidatus Korarchaeota archaeon]